MYNNLYNYFDTPILSYTRMGDVNVMWPCMAYTIALPIFKASNLNIFDETYLKLANLKYTRLESISYEMGLDMDTAKVLQKKLIDCGYIDSEGNISDSGKKYLEDRLNPSEIVGANIIVEMVSGRLLSVVIPGGLKKYYVRKSDNGKGVFFEKPRNKENFKLWNLCFIKPILNDAIPIPTKESIYYAAKTFLRRKNSSIAREIEISDFTGDLKSIEVDKTPSPCYLHIPIVILHEDNAGFYVRDPFGFGTSKYFQDEIENLLKKSDNGKLAEKISGAMKRKGSVSGESNISPIDEYKNELDEKYASVCQNYTSYIKALEENKDTKWFKNNIIDNIYSALEWALRKIYDDNKPDEFSIKAVLGGLERNKTIFCECAEKLGIPVGKCGFLLTVDDGKINSILFDSSKADMLPLLCMLIYSANINPRHPFRKMTDDLSGRLFEEISELRDLRNSIQHTGDTAKHGRDDVVDMEKIDKYKEFLENFISEMLPYIKFSGRSIDVSSDSKINIRNSLNEKLDIAIQYRISQKLRDELMQLESLHLKEDKKLYSDIIGKIYTVSQIFIDETADNLPCSLDAAKIKDLASLRVKSYFNMEELPNEILTTKKLEERLGKGRSTLAASVICLIALLDENDLSLLAMEYPAFIKDMARIISLRGHGNKTAKKVLDELRSEKEIFELEKGIYNLIKLLAKE